MDTAAIASHCGGGDGKILIWYDLSGIGKHFSQSDAIKQPEIYSGGSLITGANGKPAIEFDDLNDILFSNDSSLALSQPFTISCVSKATSGGGYFI